MTKTADSKLSCPVSRMCGGCQWMGESYEKQLQKKQQRVQELLKGICPKVNPIVGMETAPCHYRNKVHAAFAEDERGRIISGVYAQGTHRVIPVEECLIEDQRADQVIGVIRRLMEKFRIRPYDEDSGRGLVRHVLIRVGKMTGQMLVVLVIGNSHFPARAAFVQQLVKECPFITSVVVNLNGFKTSMVLGPSSRTVHGKGFIEDVLCGKRFGISPQSFYQINHAQTEKLYSLAVRYAGLTGNERLLDAYCGIGTIGLVAADHCKEVISVELNKDAVQDAIRNARRNNAQNIRFFQGDAGQFIRGMAARKEHLDVVMMDPPRAGSDEKFLKSVCTLKPERVVYVSCMPETLARDLKYLTKNGYRCVEATPVDMFPHTHHVETVILLSRKTPDAIIEIDLEMSELDLTRAESKATYKEIEEYVQNKYGLHVTNLYIAQVKREFGIIERINYNVGDGKSRVPQVTPEKREAIIDALKYFQMIEV